MKKIFFIGVLLLLFVNFVNAAYVISPEMIEERYGFKTKTIGEESYVIINENIKCEYYDFITGNCGNEFIVNCVPDGEDVWQFEHCCNSKFYIQPIILGQSDCPENTNLGKIVSWIIYNPRANFLELIILIVIISYVIYRLIKRKN